MLLYIILNNLEVLLEICCGPYRGPLICSRYVDGQPVGNMQTSNIDFIIEHLIQLSNVMCALWLHSLSISREVEYNIKFTRKSQTHARVVENSSFVAWERPFTGSA